MRLDRLGTGGFAVIATGIWFLLSVFLLLPGHLVIDVVEVDVLHALDGAMRMVNGDIPHLDFATPIGALSFGGIALPIWLGATAADAMIYSTIGVGAILLPALVWLRATRVSGFQALIIGLACLVFGMSLIYDSSTTPNTFGLFYNRWGWTIFTVVAILLLVPPRPEDENQVLDGILLAIGAILLLTIKVTFFVAICLPALVWCLGGRRWRGLFSALGASILLIALITLWAGNTDYWLYYVSDLATVSLSDIRPKPGADFLTMAGGTTGAPMTLALMVSIALLRMSGQKEPGLLLLCISPGMLLISYQNWGNGPLWLLSLFLLLVIKFPRSDDNRTFLGFRLRNGMIIVTTITGTLLAPYLLNALSSPFRNLAGGGDSYEAPLNIAGWDDLLFPIRSGHRVRTERPFLQTDEPLDDPRAKALDTTIDFAGKTFHPCQATDGALNLLVRIAKTVDAVPGAGKAQYLYADLVNVLWMFTGGTPLSRGSPWYYGGASGFDNADYVVVPKCAILALSRNTVLAALNEKDWTFEPVHEDTYAVVFQRIR